MTSDLLIFAAAHKSMTVYRRKERERGRRKQEIKSWWVWCTAVIPRFQRLRQEDLKFKVIPGFILRTYLKRRKRGGG